MKSLLPYGIHAKLMIRSTFEDVFTFKKKLNKTFLNRRSSFEQLSWRSFMLESHTFFVFATNVICNTKPTKYCAIFPHLIIDGAQTTKSRNLLSDKVVANWVCS